MGNPEGEMRFAQSVAKTHAAQGRNERETFVPALETQAL
jgi:hypothetical protein